jgi:hypothetical protein
VLVNEKGMIWKETVLDYFQSTVPAFAWREWGKPQQSSVRTAGLRAEIWTSNLQNKK